MRRALLAMSLLLTPLTALAARWPVHLEGPVAVNVGFPIPGTVEMALRQNGTGTAIVNAAGLSQTMGVRWMINAAGQVEVLIPGLLTISGTPVNGCVAGSNTQPTPALLLGLGGTPTMTVTWNICLVP